MKKFAIIFAVLAGLSIFRTASAQTPSPTINGVPPPFVFTGPGVSQSGQTLTFSGTGTGLGSITWAVPAYMTASPTTISTAGTETFSFNTQTANYVFAGPTIGSAAAPTFRALVNADIPTTLTGITIDGVTPTVMGYVDPTSSIQTQLNAKAPSSNIALSALATESADTVVMNATGGSASPTAVAMPTCTSGADLYNTTTHSWSCVTAGTTPPGGSGGQFQYNNSSAFGGVVDLTYSTHTIAGTANTIFDLSASTGTASFKVPVHSNNTATAAGVIDYDSSTGYYHGFYSSADDTFCTKNNGVCAGSGTISGQANGVIPLATGLTAITAQSHLDDGITTASTITSSEALQVPSLLVGSSGTPTQITTTATCIVASCAGGSGTLAGITTVTGKQVQVADGASSSDCSVGGGSVLHWCYYNGLAWLAANPTPATLASVSHKYMTSFTSTTGVFTSAQPVIADLSNFYTSVGAVTWNNAGTCTYNAASSFTTDGTLATVSGQSCAFTATNLISGGYYTLIITNAASTAATLTLATSGSTCTAWDVGGGGSGAITLSGSSKIDILAFHMLGTTCYANFRTNFN